MPANATLRPVSRRRRSLAEALLWAARFPDISGLWWVMLCLLSIVAGIIDGIVALVAAVSRSNEIVVWER